MKIKAIKNLIDTFADNWHIKRMDIKDQALFTEVTTPLIDRQDEEEISSNEVVEIIRKVIETGSKNLICLIKNTLESNEKYDYYVDILLTFHKNNLLNQANLDVILHYDFENRKILKTLLVMLESNRHPLTQSILNLFYVVCPQDMKISPDQKRLLNQLTNLDQIIEYDDYIDHLELLHLLNRGKLIDKVDLARMLSMRTQDFCHLEHLTANLLRHNLLNQETLDKALLSINSRLAKVKESSAQKISRKLSGHTKSRLTVTDPSGQVIPVYLQHDEKKQYPRGRYGKIKMGYKSRHKSEPAYAIKIYHMVLCLNVEAYTLLKNKARTAEEEQRLASLFKQAKDEAFINAQHEAGREAKYHELIGNQPKHFSLHNKYYLLTTWQPGKDLDKLTEKQLKAASIDTRLQCLASGVADLAVLHSRNCIHGDIKPDNFIINLYQAKMRLTDFGLSHKVSSINTHPLSAFFDDGYSISSKFCDDMYAMGYVAAHLFPEFFSSSDNNQVRTISGADSTLTGQALIALQSRMMWTDREGRCRAEDALKFCHALLENRSKLSNEILQSIITTTIARQQIDAEDVLRRRLAC